MEEMAEVSVTVRHPRSWDDSYEFALVVVAPDGTSKSGTESCDPCLVEDTTSGDLHYGANETSTYPYLVFDRVAYNGTWTVELEWSHNNILGVWEGDQVGPFHLYPSDCVHVGLSEINKTPREATVASSDCFEGGVMTFTYDGYNATFDIPART